ncbi:hypothetical protein F5Y03DRAFT_93735 [Xylaria venustula]|nr:hypothetical protein F5Y03DRAFT_93735 [Xylaria venustula]
MYNSKVLLAAAAFTGASMAQTSTVFPDPGCSSSVDALVAKAPTIPADVASALAAVETGANAIQASNLLQSPDAYVAELCSAAAELPQSALVDFGAWGSSLLNFAATEIDSYDGIVTKCVATGAEGASITSYIHSIASNPGKLCQDQTGTPSNGTATITSSYPTATGGSNSTTTGSSSPSSSIPVAGAARPTGVLAGAAAIAGLIGAVALL